MPARLTLRRPAVAVNTALGVVLLAGGFWAYRTLTGDDTPAAAASTRTVAVQQGTVTKTVTADGTVESSSTATASFVTGGTVTSISVRVGQKVVKGQVLAKVDPAEAQRSLDAAGANLDAARDAVDRAEDADADTSTAENEVEKAQLAVDEAEAAVAGTVLKAPMAGTVTAVNGTLGSSSESGGGSQASQSGSSSTASSEEGFVEIQDLTKMQVTADFAEADATKLKEKQAATITWNALNGTSATGKVTAIDPSATTANDVVTYGVALSLDKLPTGAKAGQTVSVAVTTGSVADTLMVSSAAITTVGDRHSVTVLNGAAEEVRPVEIGLEGDSATQITSGLQAGDRVVLRATATNTGQTNNRGGFPGGGGFQGGGFPGGGGGPR
ncbi:efflux RND transporter periplasmic adaptor subunit [Actinoplanes sp. Pm04-4]|uniref:Efflux RND transporter periplasmic adaptor subunit n=1 Tax=Paractinoplanes pyxinae TaxID=2997416 RepID=A0ABT4BFG6_9ACTN|nr:efflux RND transporter periplasmic adaptor subunit [Actinoplanes pyxinae]MCY1144535.1 efflux RND transporter periplasmic adaptor subunit [Actinoplanes pyxinae]